MTRAQDRFLVALLAARADLRAIDAQLARVPTPVPLAVLTARTTAARALARDVPAQDDVSTLPINREVSDG